MTTTAAPARPSASPNATHRILNFSAGPAVLPEEVIRQAQQDLWDVRGSGIGICEHSHRGPVFDAIIDEAVADCRRLASIGDDHEVLFLQGGATLQFGMIPMNFLAADAVADYPDTDVWTTKAIKEAQLFGRTNLAFEGAKSGYDHVPTTSELSLSPNAAYLYYCSNNTIYGTRYDAPPKTTAPLICDASSEMFSRPVDIDRHALIYAGAQKNLGPSGVVLVIIRKDFMVKKVRKVTVMMDYEVQAKNGSRLNTPPTFGIYMMGLVFKWILAQGGLAGMERRNDEKAKVLYDAIDGSGGFYRGVSRPECRSRMNVSFRLPSEDLEKRFLKEAAAQGMDGLKGHRDAGGIRASIYNAFPKSGCEALASFMKSFVAKNG
ncbi:MAG: 3-phosphoserine/phosphohydroxythreonine transaminase [Phycisphaerae bacterium]|nr:3-phosphoserine/phosphohydroxythreonine transaminase [Phycisphaerae bacterium]